MSDISSVNENSKVKTETAVPISPFPQSYQKLRRRILDVEPSYTVYDVLKNICKVLIITKIDIHWETRKQPSVITHVFVL